MYQAVEVEQEIRWTTGPTFLEFPFSAFNISFPPLTSFTGTDPAVSTLECL